MADSKSQKVADYATKSGTDSVKDYLALQGGLPPKKGVEAINDENTPKDCPGSYTGR